MNMFLGRELVKGPLRRLDREAMETQTLLDELDVRIDSPRKTIRNLSGGQRQGVAIARAVHWAQRLVLMDEPTAALGVAETQRVEELIRRMRDRGRAFLIVSHSRSTRCSASPTESASSGAESRSASVAPPRRRATRSSR